MKKNLIILLSLYSLIFADMDSNPIVTKYSIHKLDIKNSHKNYLIDMDTSISIGTTSNTFKIINEANFDEKSIKSIELGLSYLKPIDTLWDIQITIKKDLIEKTSNGLVGVGFVGLAPYFIETDIMLYIDKEFNVDIDIELEYDLMITQKIFLSYELESEIKQHSNKITTDNSIVIKTGYEFEKNIAPYIGVEFEKEYEEQEYEINTLFGIKMWI